MLSFEDENILNQKSLARDKLFDLVRLEMLGPIETDNTELRQQSLIQNLLIYLVVV